MNARTAVWRTLALVALLGCGRGEPLYPVSGQVTRHDGTPLAGYRVIFQAENGDYSATGQTDADGNFQLGTHRAGDGARAGRHRVAVVPPIDPRTESPPPACYPPSLRDPATSPLTREVLPQSNQISLRLPSVQSSAASGSIDNAAR